MKGAEEQLLAAKLELGASEAVIPELQRLAQVRISERRDVVARQLVQGAECFHGMRCRERKIRLRAVKLRRWLARMYDFVRIRSTRIAYEASSPAGVTSDSAPGEVT